MSEDSRQSQSHIDSIVRQEEEALERRSSAERLADAVGVFAGSLLFIVLHLVLVIAWLLVNSGKIPGARPFDPYPFSLLRSDCCRGGSHSLQFHTHASEPHDAPRGASGPPEFAS